MNIYKVIVNIIYVNINYVLEFLTFRISLKEKKNSTHPKQLTFGLAELLPIDLGT